MGFTIKSEVKKGEQVGWGWGSRLGRGGVGEWKRKQNVLISVRNDHEGMFEWLVKQKLCTMCCAFYGG